MTEPDKTFVSKILDMRQAKLDEMRKNDGTIEHLEQRNRDLKIEINTLEHTLSFLPPEEKRNQHAPDEARRPYQEMPLTEAILDVVNRFGAPPGILVPTIMKKLTDGGFKDAPKQFYATVYGVSMRLIKQGKMSENTSGEKRMFLKKQ